MLRFTAKRNALKALSSLSPRLNLSRNFLTDLSNKFKSSVELGKAKQALEKDPNAVNTFAYVRLLASERPQEAAALIERGWQAGKIPVDEGFLKEYFKSVAAMGKLDSVNMGSLLYTVNKAGSAQGVQYSAADLSSMMVSSRAAAVSPAGAAFGGGGSRESPIYVTMAPEPKKTLQRILGNMASLFLMICLVGAIMDDGKSSSTSGDASAGSSPLSGMAGRLGLPGGSIVKQAEKSDKTFNDVVGIDEAKYDLQEIVMYLKDPKRFTRLGGKLPKGVLLTGPPGTGKTLLARAIAGEAGVPFFHTSGSEFEEMYVGVGAKRVRELFETAKKSSPCIIFIDEIDAIGGSRQVKDASAMKMTLNQLLVEMDGFQQNNGIIVIAATNFPESLDSALVRPGRLDKHVDVPMPDIGGRRAILELYGSKVPLDIDVSMEQLARGTPGFSGAELFNLVNQAALKASVDGLKSVGMGALEYAKDKIMMGAERKSAVISQETMRTTAFHEAGHALMALKTAGANPIHKATIMPRGRALGMVMQLPEGDQTSQSRQQMLAFLDVCMGGRVAEEMVFGAANVTSGASNDIQQATRMARAMVTKYGFSEKVGIMFIDDKGKLSGETQKAVDDEVRELLNASYARAKHVLETHRKELNMIAAGLMEYESLSGHEIVELTQGKALNLVKRNQAPSRVIKEITTTTSSMAADKQMHKGEVRPPAGGSSSGGGGSGGGKVIEAKAPASAAPAGKVIPAKTGFLDGLFGKKPDAEAPPAAAAAVPATPARVASPVPVAAPASKDKPAASSVSPVTAVKTAVPVTGASTPSAAQKTTAAAVVPTVASAAKTATAVPTAPKSHSVVPATAEVAAAPAAAKPKQ